MSLPTDLFWFLNHLCNISFHLSPLGPSETLEPIHENWKTKISFISKTSKNPATMSLWQLSIFGFLNHLCNISFHLSPLGPSETLWFFSLFTKTEKPESPLQGLSAKSRPLLNAYNSKSIAHRHTCYNASESLSNYVSNDVNLSTVRQITKKLYLK